MNQHPDETTCDGMNIIGNEIDHAYYDSSTPDQHVDCIEIWGGASNVNIEDNRCEDTTGANQTQGMLLSGDAKNGKLINNLVVDINDQCVDDTPNGTSSTSFNNWTVENNTIDNCGNTWGGGGVGGSYGFDMNGPSSSGNVFEYNIFSSWETNGSKSQFSTDTNNDVKQGAPGSGDVTTVPQYVDHHNWQTTNLPSNWGITRRGSVTRRTCRSNLASPAGPDGGPAPAATISRSARGRPSGAARAFAVRSRPGPGAQHHGVLPRYPTRVA